MIIVTGTIESSEESIEAIKGAIAELEQATRAEEGCIDYVFSVELSRPDCIRIAEKWASKEALMAHMGQPHMATFPQAIAEHPPKSLDLKFFEAEETSLG